MEKRDRLIEFYNENHEEYGKFDRIEKPLCGRGDLCAMLLLNKFVPGHTQIIVSAEHDEFTLSVDISQLSKNHEFTETDLLTLIRCGVRFDEEEDRLFMFT